MHYLFLLSFINPALLLELCTHQSHLMHAQHEFFGMSGFMFFNPTFIIILLLVAVVLYFGVKYCWRSGSSRTETHVIVTGNGQRIESRPLPTYQQQQNQMKNQGNTVNQVPPNMHFPQHTIPQPHFKNWDRGTIFGIPSKSNQNCAVCSQHLDQGERPRVLIDCLCQHLFHPSCLSEYRERVVRFKKVNDLFKCPECKEKYSPTVELYCNACRGSKIMVALQEICTKDGTIEWEKVRDDYGQTCQNCRVV